MSDDIKYYNGDNETPAMQINDRIFAMPDDKSTQIAMGKMREKLKKKNKKHTAIVQTLMAKFGIGGTLIGRTDSHVHLLTDDEEKISIPIENIVAIFKPEGFDK